jgi:hypothetical protein
MRRLLIAAFASLLAVALIAPAAQGATEVRSLTLEGEFAGGGVHPPQMQMKIDYLVEHRNGHERLVPDRVTYFQYVFPGLVSCDQGSTVIGGDSGFLPGINIKITKKRFSSTYTTVGPATQSTVKLVGEKMWQGRTKWRSPHKKPKPAGRKFFWKRASGTLSIIDYDWPGGGFTNCHNTGRPASWSAHQCLNGSGPVYVPICQAFGSGHTADPAASRFGGR